MKIRSMIASVALVGTAMVGATACEFPEACEGLTISEQDREAAANGYEVEREDSAGNECELSEDGTWEVDH